MTYRQEYYEGEAEDRGEVLALDQQASARPATTTAVQTADTCPLEPDDSPLYAEDVGLVLTLDNAGDEELLSVTHVPVAEAGHCRTNAARRGVLTRAPMRHRRPLMPR